MNNLSISNISWDAAHDIAVYDMMNKYGYTGLEIAPSRIFTANPYDKARDAKIWIDHLKNVYGFCVPSMQSIWYGRHEMLFGSADERKILIDYTKKAIDFATTIDCRNLVFGCPRNRNMPQGADTMSAISFFNEIGEYAVTHGTTIGIEANPPIYNTNYVNDTMSALDLIKKVDSKGFLLNLDVGTMIQNDEQVSELIGMVKLINHVHISEPGLKPVTARTIHSELKKLLMEENYQRFISIEMSKVSDLCIIEEKLQYVKDVFI